MWSDAFRIFERNGMEQSDVYAEHDVIYVAITYESISYLDRMILADLGWEFSEDSNSWEKNV